MRIKKNALKIEISIPKMQVSCTQVAQILKELSHPQRLMILSHLLDGRKTVSQLVEACEIAQSQMSHFLMRMRFAGLIKSQKEGKFQWYEIADERLIHLMHTIQKEYCKHQ